MNIELFDEISKKYPGDVAHFVKTGALTDSLFYHLFDHYCTTNEMPYGTAKARTGDPYEFIEEHFSAFLEAASN